MTPPPSAAPRHHDSQTLAVAGLPRLTGSDLLAAERPSSTSGLTLKLSHPRSVTAGWLRSDGTGHSGTGREAGRSSFLIMKPS